MSSACIFTVDVEDWFHILDVPSAPGIEAWASLPSRVEANFQRLLELLDEGGARATCFFLGWVAERYPHLVRETAARHEVASHGYGHRLSYEMTREEFRQDVRRSRALLEDLAGTSVMGYRTAGFSATERTPWFFDELAEAGYRYDSSIFPARRGHGGNASAPIEPHLVATPSGRVAEFPVTVVRTPLGRMCLFGGGYLRLFPYLLIRHMARAVLAEGRPVVFYVHPREIDPSHPRLPMSLRRRFKTYVNLGTTEPKIRAILRDFQVGTVRDYLARSVSPAVEG